MCYVNDQPNPATPPTSVFASYTRLILAASDTLPVIGVELLEWVYEGRAISNQYGVCGRTNRLEMGLDLAKNAASVVAKLGLGPILNKLLALIKPMIKRAIEIATNKLPSLLAR